MTIAEIARENLLSIPNEKCVRHRSDWDDMWFVAYYHVNSVQHRLVDPGFLGEGEDDMYPGVAESLLQCQKWSLIANSFTKNTSNIMPFSKICNEVTF